MTTTTAAATDVRTFAIDKAHSEVNFQVRHLITKVRGRFTDFAGTVRFDELKSDPDKVAAAARRKDGVRVVDAQGVECFRLWIPSTPLQE